MSPTPASATAYQPDEAFAARLDADDPLKSYREQFCLPTRPDGSPLIYFCGNSLGLMPRAAHDAVIQELEDWQRLAVDAHFEGRSPWYSYHEQFRDKAARLVGALPEEVVMMNSLTVNLHLLMISFYRPTKHRYKILMEDAAFPSDTYAIKSQLRFHHHDPEDDLVLIRPRDGKHTIHPGDIESVLEDHGDSISLVLLGGVNYFSGQVFDMQRIADVAHREGCTIGLDLAHAAGNAPLALHDWGIDFAAWCTYKYLNSGPGALAGAFVHQNHASNHQLPRLAGWWGNDPKTRFKMHLQPEFIPQNSADGWQISNPPILSAAPLRASLDIFDKAGISNLREKSIRLTGYLQYLLDQMPSDNYTVITPQATTQRGCQLSIMVHREPKSLFAQLDNAGVKCDFREPNVIRVAPVPLYNTYNEVWRFAQVLKAHV
jgi:kynureninase